jgi:hypothetical protein
MILAGAYGALPALLPRRRLQAITAGGAALDISSKHAETTRALVVAEPAAPIATGGVSAPAEVLRKVEPETSFDDVEACASDESLPAVDSEMLSDLMSEIWLLRVQIESLRTELGSLSRAAASGPSAEATPVTAAESKRRTKPQAAVDLPKPLRRQVVDIRKQRRSA